MRRAIVIAAITNMLLGGLYAQAPITLSPDKVVERLWSMATAGELLTPAGWKNARSFFEHPLPSPHKTFVVVSNSYGVTPAAVQGNTAKLMVWCENVGTVDSQLRFTPAPPAPAYKGGYGYTLVFSPKTVQMFGPDGKTPIEEGKGTPEWKIDASPLELFTTVNTAVRYVLEQRERTTDPSVKANADKTLRALLKYR